MNSPNPLANPTGSPRVRVVDLTNYSSTISLAALEGILLALVLIGAIHRPLLQLAFGIVFGGQLVWAATLHLEIRPNGVKVTQLPIRIVVPWDEIRSVDPVRTTRFHPTSYCVGLELSSGRTIRCRAATGYGSSNDRVAKAVVLIRQARLTAAAEGDNELRPAP